MIAKHVYKQPKWRRTFFCRNKQQVSLLLNENCFHNFFYQWMKTQWKCFFFKHFNIQLTDIIWNNNLNKFKVKEAFNVGVSKICF